MMFRYRALIAYDGTAYSGWQIQPNGVSIQELLQKAAHTAIREAVGFTGSGRTDAGVHALGQVAHFDVSKPIHGPALIRSLNGLLPPDIRVREIVPAEKAFHARYSATGKLYHYRFCVSPVYNPFQRLYSLHLPQGLDLEKVEEAIPHLIGTHDFTSLANFPGQGLEPRDPVRKVKRITPVVSEDFIELEFEGEGFLYKMIRNIVGLLLEIAQGKRSADEIPDILKAKDRKAAGVAAPPHGLCLIHVCYERELFQVGGP